MVQGEQMDGSIDFFFSSLILAPPLHPVKIISTVITFFYVYVHNYYQ